MSCAALCVIIAFVVIFIEVGGYSQVSTSCGRVYRVYVNVPSVCVLLQWVYMVCLRLGIPKDVLGTFSCSQALEYFTKAHPILGIIVTALTVLNEGGGT
ncbi:hypothetical protein DPMN_046098 [Dreissena polymorpha]|uniref:Uncharacterized protein n=1 Tax=Dreissena polymorpha TaxID=45954 RepID=A0A9D4D7S4_DREPO|nr:hypothetical protein DPMN_046098 [Dreissena polymorpha]